MSKGRVSVAAQVTSIGSLVRVQVHRAPLHADVGGAAGGGGRRQVLGWAVMGCKFISCGKALTATIAFKIHLGSRTLWAFTKTSCSVSS